MFWSVTPMPWPVAASMRAAEPTRFAGGRNAITLSLRTLCGIDQPNRAWMTRHHFHQHHTPARLSPGSPSRAQIRPPGGATADQPPPDRVAPAGASTRSRRDRDYPAGWSHIGSGRRLGRFLAYSWVTRDRRYGHQLTWNDPAGCCRRGPTPPPMRTICNVPPGGSLTVRHRARRPPRRWCCRAVVAVRHRWSFRGAGPASPR
jgi:hypothetical protein